LNAVEIEEAISKLAEEEFDSEGFPFAFLEAFGNKRTTINRLKSGSSNSSDIEGAILQRNNIHIIVCEEGEVTKALGQLKNSPTTKRAKAKFVLATDGVDLEAEDLASGETVACEYPDFPNHFGFFLPLAGINTVQQIRNNPIDIQATGRLNRLYVELLKENSDWASDERRHDMNNFMVRLVFCFFAEDTDIFQGNDLFTTTVEQMSDRLSENTHEVLAELFRVMDIHPDERDQAGLHRWATQFPYVNGGLFAGCKEVPRFSRIARSYLLHAGSLDWKAINPDIFGSMIQAVADDEERGELGMHYTSVPNILKVLNPLFLDDLREQLEAAGDNARKLLNLRKRISNIRVFDPACGSGNFLVIAYKQMREIEHEVNERRNETHLKSAIPLTNFRGIELRDFAAEVARLALIIAEYQCDVIYRGQQDALAEFLPLNAMNWITCGNALRLNWLSICPPTGTTVKMVADDLFEEPLDQTEIDFENEGGETYICGNPPYVGGKKLKPEQKDDMKICGLEKLMQLDYVCCWFFKFSEYNLHEGAKASFVSTSSVCQGEQVALLWSRLSLKNIGLNYVYRPFKWKNNASNNAGVMCCILGLGEKKGGKKLIFSEETVREVRNISPYLIEGDDIYVASSSRPINGLPAMCMGSNPVDGKNLVLTPDDKEKFISRDENAERYIRRYVGGNDILKNKHRYCLWIADDAVDNANSITDIKNRIESCKRYREGAGRDARKVSNTPYRFCYRTHKEDEFIAFPKTSSSGREYVPAAIFRSGPILNVDAFAVYGAKLFVLSLLMSKMHNVWLATTSGRLGEGYRYSVKLSYNTFPLPKLTEKNKSDLTQCAEDILLAREAHFPETIADLYDAKNEMHEDLRLAHERNDEVLERIYIGRRFKNDTERLEKLFELYTKLVSDEGKEPN